MGKLPAWANYPHSFDPDSFDFSTANKQSVLMLMKSAQEFLQKAQEFIISSTTLSCANEHAVCDSPDQNSGSVSSDHSISNVADKSSDDLSSSVSPNDSSAIDTSVKDSIRVLTDYTTDILSESLLREVKTELKQLSYIPSGWSEDAPRVHLFGDQPYVYNNATKKLIPSPFPLLWQKSWMFCALNIIVNSTRCS